MAKQDKSDKPKPKKPLPASVETLKQDLADLTAQAETAGSLESDLESAKTENARLVAALTVAQTTITKLRSGISFTKDDEEKFVRMELEIEFKRSFKDGLPVIKVRGTAPKTARPAFQARTFSEVVAKLRAIK